MNHPRASSRIQPPRSNHIAAASSLSTSLHNEPIEASHTPSTLLSLDPWAPSQSSVQPIAAPGAVSGLAHSTHSGLDSSVFDSSTQVKRDNDANRTGDGNVDDQYVQCLDKVKKLKKTIKRRRVGTFCCCASIGTLLVSVVLVVMAFTSLFAEFEVYERSQIAQCTLRGVDNVQIDSSSPDCIYRYDVDSSISTESTADAQVTERALCSYSSWPDVSGDVGVTRECAIYHEAGSDSLLCRAVGFVRLQREHNMFLFVLIFGALFGVVSISCALYALCSAKAFGLYHSTRGVEDDSSQMEMALQELHSHSRERGDVSEVNVSSLNVPSVISELHWPMIGVDNRANANQPIAEDREDSRSRSWNMQSWIG